MVKIGVNEYIHKLSFRLNINIGQFVEWKSKFMNEIRYKINITPNNFPCTVNIRRIQDKIKEVQDKFIIVPVDKASNNFGFICKKYYAQVLAMEMDSSDTFEVINTDLVNIRELNVNFLKSYNLKPANFELPFIYCIPKFHKNPTKFRYITSSFKCINKEASVILNLALDKLYEKVVNETDNCWIIKNHDKVIDAISRCNESPVFPGNYMLATFDFSTLYTSLPHSELIRCIVALYNKHIHSEIEIVYKYKKLIISKTQFVNMLKFCINNSYIYFNNEIYRQKVGIPMGSNFSPNMANLFLHFHEARFLNRNHEQGRNRYKLTSRFIDDLISINNRDILHDTVSIYPNYLEINSTNENPYRSGSFLDIDIKINNNKFLTTVYDKRRDFNFEILGLPAFMSNTPVNMTFGVICSQFSRFAKICMESHDFISNCQLVINKIRRNGFPANLVHKLVKKFKYKKAHKITKFRLPSDLNHLLEF